MGLFDETVKGASYDEAQGYKQGHTWSGTVTDVGQPKQATEYVQGGQGKPLFFPSGDPIMEQPVTIQTEQVQPQGMEETGQRVIFFGGEKLKALKAAMKASGMRMREPRPGDWLSLTWTGNGGTTGRRKLFTAQFRPGPEPTASMWSEQPRQAPAVQPQVQAPAPQQAPAMAGGGGFVPSPANERPF